MSIPVRECHLAVTSEAASTASIPRSPRRARAFFAALGSVAVAAACVLAVVGLRVPAVELEPEAFAAGDASTLSFVVAAQKGTLVPPDLDDIEQMCALLTSCPNLPIPPGVVPADFGECVRKMSTELASASGVGYSLTLRECGLKANSCEALRLCALRGADPKSCDGRGAKAPVGYCDESGRALTCYQSKVWLVRNCPYGGESCRVAAGGAHCILGPCSADAGEGSYCSGSGTRVLQCEHGRLTSLDCAAFGLQCSNFKSPDGGMAVGCSTGSKECVGTGKRCDGKTAIACFNGHEVRVDCAAAGLTCDTNPSSPTVGACVVTSSTCKGDDSAKCDGNAIKYCAQGRPRSYPCSALFTTCKKDGPAVHCVKP